VASDGNWYPPEQHPDVAGPPPAVAPALPPKQPVWADPGGGQWPTVPAGVSSATRRSSFTKPVVLAVAAVAILAVVGVTLSIALGGSSSTSPQSVAATAATDLRSGNYAQLCTLAPPAQGQRCRNDMNQISTHDIAYKPVSLGKVTVSGDRALFVLTGSVCEGSGQCLSNNDASAATDKGKTFNQVYAAAIGPSSSSPFILPMVEQGGSWYVTGF
jgi:hypothetical protein